MSWIAIVQSYKRPQNINHVVAPLLEVSRFHSVIVCNNNPEIELKAHLRPEVSSRARLIQPREAKRAGFRFDLAYDLAADFFAFVDDDVILSPGQIETLMTATEAAPDRAHGFFGELVTLTRPMPAPRVETQPGIVNAKCEVDVLNLAYFVAAPLISRFQELLRVLGYRDTNQLGRGDDILISVSGRRRPFCHDIGDFQICRTSHSPAIATWKGDGFAASRAVLYARLAPLLAEEDGPRRTEESV